MSPHTKEPEIKTRAVYDLDSTLLKRVHHEIEHGPSIEDNAKCPLCSQAGLNPAAYHHAIEVLEAVQASIQGADDQLERQVKAVLQETKIS